MIPDGYTPPEPRTTPLPQFIETPSQALRPEAAAPPPINAEDIVESRFREAIERGDVNRLYDDPHLAARV